MKCIQVGCMINRSIWSAPYKFSFLPLTFHWRWVFSGEVCHSWLLLRRWVCGLWWSSRRKGQWMWMWMCIHMIIFRPHSGAKFTKLRPLLIEVTPRAAQRRQVWTLSSFSRWHFQNVIKILRKNYGRIIEIYIAGSTWTSNRTGEYAVGGTLGRKMQSQVGNIFRVIVMREFSMIFTRTSIACLNSRTRSMKTITSPIFNIYSQEKLLYSLRPPPNQSLLNT